MSPKCGPRGFRPRVGLRPNTPQHAAGMRMEPPASFPWAIGTMPEATAAPAPPLEPPGVRVVSHGIARGPEPDRLGRGADRHLRQVRLSYGDQSRAFPALDQLRVLAGHEVSDEVRGLGEPDARVLGQEVLDQERDAGEWAVWNGP